MRQKYRKSTRNTHAQDIHTCTHTHKTHENTKTIIDKQKRVKVKKHNLEFILCWPCTAWHGGGVPLSVACVPFPFVRGCQVDSPWFRDGSSCPFPLSGMGLHLAWPSAAPAHAAVVSWVHLYTSPSLFERPCFLHVLTGSSNFSASSFTELPET